MFSYEEMNEVGQGRVWTGRQASQRGTELIFFSTHINTCIIIIACKDFQLFMYALKGLVDHIGGLFKALDIVNNLTTTTGSNKISSGKR